MALSNDNIFQLRCITARGAGLISLSLVTLITFGACCDQRPFNFTTCHGIPCYHGDCKYKTHPSSISARCVCYDGWLESTHCMVCCQLPCVHGVCDGNSQSQYCICEDGFSGTLCEMELCLKRCENKGRCDFDENRRQYCMCPPGFSGDLCDIVDRNYKPPWLLAIIALVVLLAMFLITLAIVMPYVMWKRRALIVLKIHYFFQKYKDDDSLRYDAFVSCSSSGHEDTDFLMEKLSPMLEKNMGYKVCFNERNFLPGTHLIDNICTAITQSRRTIMIISPSYIEDTWPVFEAQIATHKSLKSAHRIIPIIYKDVGQISHPTLRNILSSLQCLRWPQKETPKDLERFRKKLNFLMPKKRNQSSIGEINPRYENDVDFVL